MNRRKLYEAAVTALAIVGCGLIVAGIAMLSVPLGVIAGGVVCLGAAVLFIKADGGEGDG